MLTVIPERISRFPISAATSTDELFTLGRYFAEVGGYASSLVAHDTMSVARLCDRKLRKVTAELSRRKAIKSADDLFRISSASSSIPPLHTMSVDELETLYRQSSIRRAERKRQGREHFTFYQESKIVNELKKRKPENIGEQIKIDYCVTTYSNELENMSSVFSIPVDDGSEKIFPDPSREYSHEELAALVRLYAGFRDISAREILVEYVDRALDILGKEPSLSSAIPLATEIVELGRRKIINVPDWINSYLREAVSSRQKGCDPVLVIPMLTIGMVDRNPSMERNAKRIINRCYKNITDSTSYAEVDVESLTGFLHTAVMCCDYVSRFSVRKAAAAWHAICSIFLSSTSRPSPLSVFRMLETAGQLKDFAPLSPASMQALTSILEKSSDGHTQDLEAKAYLCLLTSA